MAWEHCAAVAGDQTGRLYGVAKSDKDHNTSVLWVADVYPEALKSQDSQEATVPLDNVSVIQVVQTVPAIDFTVTAASVSADGHQLLLVGTAGQEDAVPVLALVDIYGSQPTASSSSSSSSTSAHSSVHPAAKQRIANLYYVHQSLHSQRPSMRILQASWHPSSPSHFATLATDNRWRLYHTSHLAEPEQTFALHPPGSQHSTIGLRRGGLGGSGVAQRFTAFTFGPAGAGWVSLAVLFLASSGGVFVLCPVAPFGMRVAASVLQRLLDDNEGTAHAWLLAAFLSVLAHESDAVSARPHMLETAAPALQGPLNKGAESLKLKTARSVACTIALSSSSSSPGGLAGLSLSQSGVAAAVQGVGVLATGFSNGTVYAHALELGQVLPVWVDATPQCAYDKKGEVAAVKYEVDIVPTAPATDGVASVAEDANGAAAGLVSPLLLLDVLKINLHSPAAGSSQWAGDEDDWEDGPGSFDSEEESDAGYDPSAAAGGFGSITSGRRRPGSSSSRPGGGSSRGLGIPADADDDEAEDLEDQQFLQLTKVTLHVAPELPGRFWACHDQGCWGINIRWLQQVASKFAAAAAGQQQGQQQQQLPAPVLQELLVTGSTVTSSCVVGNALLGSGCVVLEASGSVCFLRPRPAGVLGEGVLGDREAVDEIEGLGLGELALTEQELDAKSRMEDFYADICRGPRRLPPPAKPANLSQLTAADPAGLKYLNEVTTWLLQTHVQFAHGAHADLVERVKQLHAEAHEQSAAVASLKELAAAAAERQEAIAARLSRLGEVADTLAERSSLLAGLHWSLPRPSSAAEQQLDKQLEVWEQQRDQLKVSWRALRARLDTYAAAASQQQQQSSAAATPSRGFGISSSPLHTPPRSAAKSPFLGVPALAANRAQAKRQVTKAPEGSVSSGQLEKLKEMLAVQNDVIAQAREKLAGLFEEIEGFRREHPEVELPGKLRSHIIV